MKPVTELKDNELANVIANYKRLERTQEPYFIGALEEWNRRKGGGLNIQKTLRAIWNAAREGHCLCYKDIADINDMEWSKARYPIYDHLGTVIEIAHNHKIPLLSSVIVNKQNLETGNMDTATLVGFCKAARSLGYVITDEETFQKEQMEAVFAWAKNYDPSTGALF